MLTKLFKFVRFVAVSFALFALLFRFGAVDDNIFKKGELTYTIKPVSFTSAEFYDDSVFFDLLSLDFAAQDERITKLNIVVKASINLPTWYVQELIKVIISFKMRGKKVAVWMQDVRSMADFILLSAGDERYIEYDTLKLFGYEVYRLFEAKKNEKKKRELWAVQFGDFKGGVTNYLGKEFDVYMAFNLRGFMFDLLHQSKEILSLFLGKNSAEIESYIQHGYYTVEEAKELGIVTNLKSYVAKEDHIMLRNYARKYKKKLWNNSPNVCVVEISGPIVGEVGDMYAKALCHVAEQPNIKAVLLFVNSPGGDVVASQKIDQAVEFLQKKGKYVVAYVANAFSGGYMVISSVDKIFANPGSGVGSIGAYYVRPKNWAELEKKGYTVDFIGTHEAEGGMQLTERGKDFLHNKMQIDDFASLVAKRRNFSNKLKNDLAQGQIYTGKAGYEIGLVDSLDGFVGALNLLCVVCDEPLGFTFIPYYNMQ